MGFRKIRQLTQDVPETKLRVRSPKDPKGAYISITLTGQLLKLDMLHEINNRDYDPYPEIDSDVPFQTTKTELKQCSEWLGDMGINKKIAQLLISYLTPQTDRPGWLSKVRKIHEIMKSNAVFAILAFRLGMASHPTDKSSANTLEEYYNHLELAKPKVCDKWMKSVFRPLIEWIKVHHYNQQRTHEQFLRSRHPEQLTPRFLKAEPQTRGAMSLGIGSGNESVLPETNSHGPHFIEDEDGMLVLQEEDDDDDDDDDDDTGTDDPMSNGYVPPKIDASRITYQASVKHSSHPSSDPVEYRKMRGRVLDLDGMHILTLLNGLNSTRTVKVLLRFCKALEKSKYRNGTLKLSWKPLSSASLNQSSLNDISDDEDEDIEVLNVVSKLTVGMDILVWVPFQNGKELRGMEDVQPFILTHPWDASEVRGPELAR